MAVGYSNTAVMTFPRCVCRSPESALALSFIAAYFPASLLPIPKDECGKRLKVALLEV